MVRFQLFAGKNGATIDQVLENSFRNESSLDRLDQLEEHFAPSIEKSFTWWELLTKIMQYEL